MKVKAHFNMLPFIQENIFHLLNVFRAHLHQEDVFMLSILLINPLELEDFANL